MANPTTAPPFRSPSPTPSPPIAATPGPRATILQRLYDDAVTHVVKTCSYENFAACFPTPAARVPGSMAQLHAQFTERLGAKMREEFAGILEERGVVGSLNQLDGLIDEARAAKRRAEEQRAQTGGEVPAPIPPHTLPAERLYLAHLMPLLAQPMQEMRTRQTTLENENVELLSRVQQQRREIEAMVKGLESAAGDLETSVTQLRQAPDAEVLREELREVEVEMRD